MIHAAARFGYSGASVARVVERAGVSRATFYEHFANREECFMAAQREVAARMGVRMAGAEALGGLRVERPFELLEVALEGIAAEPEAARLLLIEALASPPSVRADHDRLIASLEGWLETNLDAGRERGAPVLPAAALLGGIVGTVSIQLLEGETTQLAALAGELGRWLDSYRPPEGSSLPGQEHWQALGSQLPLPPPGPVVEAVNLLPRGRGALSNGRAGEVRRARIVAAAARLTMQRGYQALTVSEIVAAARVTRGVFYSHFRCKEDTFLAAQSTALRESVATAAAEFFSVTEWPEQVWRAGRALLAYVVANPALAHVGFVETNAAGKEAIRRQQDARNAFTIFLEEGYRLGIGTPPRIASEAIAWGVFALIRREVVAGRTAEVPCLLPACCYVILAPFIGPTAALEFVESRSRSAFPGSPAMT